MKSPIELRVIDQLRDIIRRMFELFGVREAADQGSSKHSLRMWQKVVSGCNVAIVESASELRLHTLVVEKFWQEVRKLEGFGYHKVLGSKTTKEFEDGTLSRLAKKVDAFFTEPTYYVGLSQRYVVPVWKGLPWRVQIEILARALAIPARAEHLELVGGKNTEMRAIEVVYSPGFEEQYDASRKVVNRPSIEPNVYVLCGVHGGRDTHDFTAKDSIVYFARTHRLALTLKEALALYTAHPEFLSERNSGVILLGEECEGKYVTLSLDQPGRKLFIALVSLDEADRALRLRSPLPHEFHGAPALPTYGKPSAGAVIVP